MKSNIEILAEVLDVSVNSIRLHKSATLRVDEALEAMNKLVKLFTIPDVINCNHDFQRVVRGGEFQGNQCTICEKWEDLT